MQIDPEELKRHYALLSDEALLDIDAADLTDAARMYYQGEMAHRKLAPAPKAQHEVPKVQVEAESPDELAVVGTFQDPSELAEARDVLENAGIPCSIQCNNYRWEVFVPAAVRQQAEQILNKQYFDPESEVDYQTHFQLLDDEELLALRTTGLSEVARRLRDEELTLRGLVTRNPTARTDQMTDAGLQLVATFLSGEEAQSAQALLESTEIPCFLQNEDAQVWSGDGELRLMVPEEFYDQACEILEASQGNDEK